MPAPLSCLALLTATATLLVDGSWAFPIATIPKRATLTRLPATGSSNQPMVDANAYNIPLEDAAELWTVSVSPERRADRDANIPYLDSKSKDYFVDDLSLELRRDDPSSGLGLELLELAGGRDDGYGITIVTAVTGIAEAAGILPGDSIARVSATRTTKTNENTEETTTETRDCECRDFDATIACLTAFRNTDEDNDETPPLDSLVLDIKRLRRWPKIRLAVEYPPSQCAEGVDNTEYLELFAGENLRRAMLNRGIVMEDPRAPKCDFCGAKCNVKVDVGFDLLSPMSTTEEKLMKQNPKCRLSCKATVGHNMREGNVRLRINLRAWSEDEKKERERNSVY